MGSDDLGVLVVKSGKVGSQDGSKFGLANIEIQGIIYPDDLNLDKKISAELEKESGEKVLKLNSDLFLEGL